MWWQATVLVVTAAAVTAQQFNPNDESEFIDDVYEDEPTTASIWVSDIVSTEGGKVSADIQGEVEKLLGQPVIHYDEPSTIKISADEFTSSPRVPERSIGVQERSIIIALNGIKLPSPSTVPSVSHWSDSEVIGLSSKTPKPARSRHRTSEVVYNVRVPQWDDIYAQVAQKARPGVIESLVNAHEVVQYETPRALPKPLSRTYGLYDTPTRMYASPTRTHESSTRTYDGLKRTFEGPTRTYEVNQTAYNEGGFRYRTTVEYEDNLNVLPLVPTGRRYLVTIEGALLSTSTRRPRPTPVTEPLHTVYAYTRRTRRHPNCTDSYYECLFKCFDRKGYRVKCPWDTTPKRPEPNRMNFTGLFWAIQRQYRMTEYDVSNIFWGKSLLPQSWKDQLIEKGYRSCRTFTTRTTTTKKMYPIYYDDVLSPKTGRIMAKCWVCGLFDYGIPQNSHCADNFGHIGSAAALSEKNAYRKYCRFMDEVPLWFNRSDPHSVFGQWTGGCSYRWLDVSGLYTQRACRSVVTPAMGHHFLSKRMARLELALREVREGCVVSPMATLVPFSRAVSLYARFHVCVCKGTLCNAASLKELYLGLLISLFVICVIRVFQW